MINDLRNYKLVEGGYGSTCKGWMGPFVLVWLVVDPLILLLPCPNHDSLNGASAWAWLVTVLSDCSVPSHVLPAVMDRSP